ncbi:MAG: LysR substrate-binding domain-containing protein [Paracoccus sp. (in: a-proteobacteria)]|uniref:LysR substrate-binding domain-containing protein n=1 Tax=Paracoccus sp. TaxID=267 RepID=UPI0026DEAD3B|nr:LysR substrate-binding domain-containing protein [Paracoccus sp. (in: a-proteobacteria)]MDO5614075.1 LysR substrate-binding domain-containing protein [Paracoccus sp. (in: a-proteobacteria)]
MDPSTRVRGILSFVHAADAGSFAAAGRALGISAAAVSKNVAGLEVALGLRLMNRTTRSLQLTHEGTVFLAQSRTALRALDLAVETARAGQMGPAGPVRVSSVASFGRGFLLPKLPGLIARHPALQLTVDFDDRVTDLVRDGYDIVIRGGHIPETGLIARPICTMTMAVVAAPAYLAAHDAPRQPDDLLAHRLIARGFLGGGISPWQFRVDGGETSFDPGPNAAMILSDPAAVLDAAIAGAGITRLGVHLIWPHLQSGALRLVLHDHHHPGDYQMVMQYPHRALIAPRVRATVDYLLDAFAADKTLHIPPEALEPYRN